MPSVNLTADENGEFRSRLPEQLTNGERVTIRIQDGENTDSVTMTAPDGFVPPIPQSEVIWMTVLGDIMQSDLTFTVLDEFPQSERTDGLFEIKNLSEWENRITTASEWMNMIHTFILPNNMTNVPNRFLKNWTRLRKLVIGQGTVSIGAEAFSNLLACQEITCLANTPPTFVTDGLNSSFYLLPTVGILKVPSNSVSLYESDPSWSSLGLTVQAI